MQCINVYNINMLQSTVIMNIYNNEELDFMYEYSSAGNTVNVWIFETMPSKYTNILIYN